ncbi:GNAT family N-acetyltransferase [Gillisia sp. CAL575]|uniref:GNAT family N-acetyltransferase n=1 Tax=Gillisia sp. CAL575 TaxID=985255 RepID=UPI000399FCD4|nr:GNAT family N-acetyltransferase [Gillisia sp. CAL575]
MNLFELSTNRLSLVALSQEELQFVHALHSNPEVDFYNTLGIPTTIEDTEAILNEMVLENEKEDIRKFTFCIKLNDQSIGLIALNLGNKKYEIGEIWYKFLPEFWNQGFATEALKVLIHFGFHKLKLHRIEAGCASKNIGSVKVLEKAGMIREGHKRQHLPLKSGWADCYEYGMLITDLKGS